MKNETAKMQPRASGLVKRILALRSADSFAFNPASLQTPGEMGAQANHSLAARCREQAKDTGKMVGNIMRGESDFVPEWLLSRHDLTGTTGAVVRAGAAPVCILAGAANFYT